MLYKDKKWFCEQVNQGKTVNIVAETFGVSKRLLTIGKNTWDKTKTRKRKYQSSCDETFLTILIQKRRHIF